MTAIERAAGDFPGDIELFSRLRLTVDSALAHPAATISHAQLRVRGTAAGLAPDGDGFFAVSSNFVELDGIDVWINGVHLDSHAEMSGPSRTRTTRSSAAYHEICGYLRDRTGLHGSARIVSFRFRFVSWRRSSIDLLVRSSIMGAILGIDATDRGMSP
jgi:hypothetical protein